MLKFIFKRLLEALPTLFILITFSFFLMRLAPGSPFTSERAYPPEVMANIEAKYHLNEPLYKQYFLYLENLSKGDFGPSFKYKDQSVNDLIASAFPVSLKLGMVAFAFAVVLGVTAGTLAALNQNSRWDYILMSFSMLGVIMPSFVFAPVLVLIFAIYLGWLPAGGWNGGSAIPTCPGTGTRSNMSLVVLSNTSIVPESLPSSTAKSSPRLAVVDVSHFNSLLPVLLKLNPGISFPPNT